jgi:diguanylate cyclase (GGDEF)-like protein
MVRTLRRSKSSFALWATSNDVMRTEKINLNRLLKDILNRDSFDADLRREIGSALAEPDTLVAWEKTLEIMQGLHRSGKLVWQGVTEKNGERYIKFRDPATGNVLSLVEPPTVRAEVLPCLPRGFVGKKDADRIESLFTSIATCRSEDELGGVLKKMLATIREMVSADFGAVYLIEEGMRDSIDRVSDGSPAAPGRFAPSLVDRWVVGEGFCVHVPDLNRGQELQKYTEKGSFASVVVMPLRSRGKNYGLLEVWSRRPGHFTTDDLGFLALLALLAAGMIRNAEHLETLIFRDPLTHVYNRGFMEDQLLREIERYKRTNEPVAFLLVDVDNFKQVNTRFGHPVGDVVLSAIGHLLEDKVRQIDVVSRYGGDEFGIILPDTIAEHALVTAERLRSVIEANEFAAACPELGDIRITISIGGAMCPDDAVTKENLIERADRALAEAERAGKNQVVFAGFTPPSNEG